MKGPNLVRPVVVAVALVALSCMAFQGDALAKKPPKPPPEPEGGSVIHFEIPSTSSPDRGQWIMDPDGGNKTLLPEGISGEPSVSRHSGHRWLVRTEAIPGGFYPVYIDDWGGPPEDLEILSFDGDPDPAASWRVRFHVRIESNDPDAFTWYCECNSLPGCASLGPSIEITGDPQDLDAFGNGSAVLTIQFGQTTGHHVGDYRTADVTKNERREVVVIGQDGEGNVFLTDHPQIRYADRFRWSNGDTLLTWDAQLWDDAENEAVDGGVFGLALEFDGAGTPGPVGEPTLLLHNDRNLNFRYSYCPSPDGTRIVFDDIGPGGLYIIDLDTQQVSEEITPFGEDPDWALSGDWIAFRSGFSEIWKVRPDGGNLTLLKQTNPDHPRYEAIGYPRWSPDASYLLYLDHETYTYYWSDVYKMKANGRVSTNLTADTDERAYPVAWVEEPASP